MARLTGEFHEDPATNCWIWQRGKTGDGYGGLCIGRVVHLAHRVYYEETIGPIPDGLTIDHLCRNRACVNPGHMEVVTRGENVLRSPIAHAAVNAQKTHCIHGHPFDEANTYWHPGGYRQCRKCQAIGQRRHRARKAAA